MAQYLEIHAVACSAAIAPLPADAIVPAVGLAFDPASLVSLVQIQKAEEENPADIPEDVEFVDSADLGLAPSPGPSYPELLNPYRYRKCLHC